MQETIATTAEAHEAGAMPRRIDVHCDDPHAGCAETLPEAVTGKPLDSKSPAEWAYERLILYIQNFEATLDAEHEVAIGLAGTEAGILRIEGMGFFDPDIVTFYGTDPAGTRAQLVQHVSQLNVLLRTLPRAVERTEPRRIGFRLAQALDET